MFVTEQDPQAISDESPWIRRCCPSNAGDVGATLERPVHENEMQGLLCCQHNGRPRPQQALEAQIPCTTPLMKPISLLVFEQFVRFCKHTSLRGVPRIVKAKDRKLRLLWTVFFLIFLIGCFVCVVMMVLQYLDHDTMEKPMSLENNPQPFPSVTVCNTRPLSVRGIELLKANRVMMTGDYLKLLMHKFRMAHRQIRFNKVERRYLSNAIFLSMYLQALPKHIRPAELGHRLDEMILKCNVMLTDGPIKVTKMCHEIGTWTTTLHDVFLNCYTFTVTNTSDSKKSMKVNMTLYLGEVADYCNECPSTYASQIDGLRLEIHEANTYPSVNEGGMYLSPGKLTEIEFKTLIRHMKEPPYGSCRENQPKNITLDEHLFTFSRSACFISEVQRRTFENCNCLSAEKPVPKELMLANNISYCRRVILSSLIDAPLQQEGMDELGNYRRDFIMNFIAKLKCRIDTESQYQLEHDGCLKRCVVSEFETTISSTRWPTRSYQDDFLKDIQVMKNEALAKLCDDFMPSPNYSIADCVIAATSNNFVNITSISDLYDGILKWRRPMNESLENSTVREMKRMLRDEFFNDHLVSLIVRRPHFGVKLIMEKEVITLTSLLSQVGGLLSIFIGLNFAFVVEIIELIYNIFQSIRHKTPPK